MYMRLCPQRHTCVEVYMYVWFIKRVDHHKEIRVLFCSDEELNAQNVNTQIFFWWPIYLQLSTLLIFTKHWFLLPTNTALHFLFSNMNPILVSEEKEVHVGPKGSQTQQTKEEKRKTKKYLLIYV